MVKAAATTLLASWGIIGALVLWGWFGHAPWEADPQWQEKTLCVDALERRQAFEEASTREYSIGARPLRALDDTLDNGIRSELLILSLKIRAVESGIDQWCLGLPLPDTDLDG